MFGSTPDPIAFQLGPLPVYWYGIGYAVGLAAVYVLLVWLARRAGEDPELVGNGIIIVAVAALIGGRLYHVIDQWALYQDDPISIILPPYTGLGAYGGLLTGTLAVVAYTRYKRVSFWRWVDIVAPGVFLMQAIARWGNFFNQELYGPPTTLPWGIPIDCEHRIAAYPCSQFPFETTAFHPLFLYESLSGLIGVLALVWIGFRFRHRLRPGDIAMIFFIWYGLVRFVLETLRSENWTFYGIPTAQLVSLAFILGAVIVLIYRHRPGHRIDDEGPTHPEAAVWGAVGPEDGRRTERIDEPWAHAGELASSAETGAEPEALGVGPPEPEEPTPPSPA
jgi:phosphatidylglycerol:prolipoprotein diacylglycerol transferase